MSAAGSKRHGSVARNVCVGRKLWTAVGGPNRRRSGHGRCSEVGFRSPTGTGARRPPETLSVCVEVWGSR